MAAYRQPDRQSGRAWASIVAVLVSYCVVNTNGRELLLACLDAIERTTPSDLEHEVLVLDNASDDGSADAVRALDRDIRLIALERRAGKAANDSRLLQEANGEFCLLLNEDSELQPGAVAALLGALQSDRDAAVAGAQLLAPDGREVPCAWRLPSGETALAGGGRPPPPAAPPGGGGGGAAAPPA